MRHRRSVRTLRRHLWLSGVLSTLCFAGVVGLASLVPALDAPRPGARTGAEGVAPASPPIAWLPVPVWPALGVALIASVLSANLLFERMRRPLVGFLRCYESIAEGVVPAQIPIRSTDYLADETDALNAMIASLRRQQSVRSEAVARLEEAISDLAAHGAPENVLSDLQEVAKRLSVPSSRRSPDDGGARGAR